MFKVKNKVDINFKQIVNFEQISHIVLMFSWLILKK